MQKKKTLFYIIIAIMAAILLLMMGILIGTSHSDSSYKNSATDAYDDYGYDYISEGSNSLKTASTEEDVEESSTLFAQSEKGQKLVYTGDVVIGTDNIDKSYSKITDNMKEFNASFESVSDSSYNKHMTIRVPKDNFMKFYESLSKVDGSITSSNVSIDDMTKAYQDNERRMDILQTEYDEMKDLMKKAESVDDVLSIRDRLSDITYELESLKESNNSIDYDSNYSRIEITLQLTGNASPVSFGYQIKQAFVNSIQAIKTLFLFLIEIWWVLLIIAGGIYYMFKRKPLKQKKEENNVAEEVPEIKEELAENTEDEEQKA